MKDISNKGNNLCRSVFYAESRRIGTIRPTCIKPMLYEVLNYKPLKKIKMWYYRQLLKNWQNILDAMDKIDKDNQSRYFYDFKKEVKNRVDEYKFLSEKEKTRFGNVPFPFEAELNEFDDDDF